MANKIIWVASSARAGGTGTEASPYATIQAAVNAAGAGTTIMVKAGVYTENVVFSKSGVAGAPIELVSADGVGKAEIRPANSSADTIRVSAVNYITIDGFKVFGPSLANTIHVSSANNMTKIPAYITIKNNDIRPDAGDGVKISQGDHISIIDNKVVGSTHEQGIDAVGVTHSIISSNDVSGVTGGAAIQVKGGSIDVEISYNTVHDTGRWGILVGGSTNVQNLLPGTTTFEATNVRVFGNEVDGSMQQALRIIGAQDVNVTGNWFHDVSSSRFIDIVSSGDTHAMWPSRNITFNNNSFDRASWLTVDSGQGQYTAGANRTDGNAPTGWVDPDSGTPAPTPTPDPIPAPGPAPLPTPVPAPAPTPTQGVAHDDKAKTTVGKAVVINLLANDDPVNWTNATIANPKYGVLSKAADAESVTYTPKKGFVGTDTFKYTLTDSHGHDSTATVTVTVQKYATVTSYDLMI